MESMAAMNELESDTPVNLQPLTMTVGVDITSNRTPNDSPLSIRAFGSA